MKILFIISLAFFNFSIAAVLVQQRVDLYGNILSVEGYKYRNLTVQDIIIIKNLPEFLFEKQISEETSFYQEVLVPDSYFTSQGYNIEELILIDSEERSWPGSEVRTLVNQGPVENRIDLTFVGDGYTLEEKEKFFQDIQILTNDLFQGQTFASYLPLFNVHAVFVPSQESGITDTQKKFTSLGLYRNPVGSKRAIMPGNMRAIENAIKLAPDSDYPILIANDDFYGGLGGRYAISTRSPLSGAMVLRHELGHNFGNVGEEYDGGQVYSGANFSTDPQRQWGHWLTSYQVFDSKFLSGDYVWKNLKEGSYKAHFNFPVGNYFFDLIISSVGWDTPNDVNVLLNGKAKEIDGIFTEDRSFFKLKDFAQVASGRNTIEIKETQTDGNNVLAFAMAYAHPQDLDKNAIAAYSTFDSNGYMRGYRPTFDMCLMRDMRSPYFCPIDQENMWIQFFKTVSLIDYLSVLDFGEVLQVTAHTPSLNLVYDWEVKRSNGVWEKLHLPESQIQIPKNIYKSIKLNVEFKTPEIRMPGYRVLSEKEMKL